MDGDVKEAMKQAKRFLDTLICDDELYGCIDITQEELPKGDHWACNFLTALLSLYSCKYEQALQFVEKVLAVHQCQEALYVKSRALAQLERYKEADDVNALLAEVFDMSTPDAKTLYMMAMLNELHIGDPGMGMMQKLVEVKPKYDKGILALRKLMKLHGIQLDSLQESELIDVFNSEIEDVVFASLLKECREKAPKAVAYLTKRIRLQEFDEELSPEQ